MSKVERLAMRRMVVASNAFDVLGDLTGDSLRVETMSEILESEVDDDEPKISPILLTRTVDISNRAFQSWWEGGEPLDLTIRYLHRGLEVATRKLSKCVPVAYSEGDRSVRDNDERLIESLVLQPKEVGRRRPSVAEMHLARVRDLTFKYEHDRMLGIGNRHEWVGYCEAVDESWIAFFNEHGGGYLYEKRDSDGAVMGEPLFFYREDVAREYNAYIDRAWKGFVLLSDQPGLSNVLVYDWLIDKVHRNYSGLSHEVARRVLNEVLTQRISYAHFTGTEGGRLVSEVKQQIVNEREAREKAVAALRTQLDADRQNDREHLGKIVREEWIKWAKEQPLIKPSWVAPWDELSESDREVDRRIGERLYNMGLAAKAPSVGA